MTKLTVTTATALSEKRKAELEKEFAAKYKTFTVDYVVNDAIIGGMVLFDGEKIYDGSVSRQLDKILEGVKGNVKK